MGMNELMLVVSIVAYGALVVSTSVHPHRSSLSAFERKRQKKQGKDTTLDELREQHYDVMVAFLRIEAGLLLVIAVLSVVASLGWVIGVTVAVIGVLEYVALARLSFVRKFSQRLYDKYELPALQFADRYGKWLKPLSGASTTLQSLDTSVQSRDELLHVVEQSGTLLSSDEKQLIRSGLAFGDQTVASVMTPRSVINSIAKDELLGPLTLDELYKTGNSRFPVTDGDIDHVVGVLHLRDLISLEQKKSAKAEKAMKTPVYYIKETQTLQQALAAFLKTHNLLFIVVNEYRETVGVLSLEDVLEALLGRKIMDEFDAHEDLRAVAARNPRKNNQPRQHHDV